MSQAPQQEQAQAMQEQPKYASPLRKGLGSIVKGLAILFGGPIGIAAVAGYNLAMGVYRLSQNKLKSGVSYLLGSLLAPIAPLPYGIGLEASGAHRVAKRKYVPWDYVEEFYGKKKEEEEKQV